MITRLASSFELSAFMFILAKSHKLAAKSYYGQVFATLAENLKIR